MSSQVPQPWCEPRVILVATNLDDQPALMTHAVAEARRSGARLLLVHVIPSPAADQSAAASPPPVCILPSTHQAADALEHMALRLRWQGILCEPVILKGRPDQEIEALVRSRNVDRVIVAVRDGRGREPSSRRSVADCLMTVLPVPVCVVSRQAYPDSLRETRVERVLLPLSLRADRPEYVDFACGVARARRARLTLLHVVHLPSVNQQQRVVAQDAARLRMAALAAIHEDLQWRPDVAIRDGDPATEIVEEASCPFRDLIILGSSSLTTARQENGVIARVLGGSRCPVITLKPPASVARAEQAAVWEELKTGSLD